MLVQVIGRDVLLIQIRKGHFLILISPYIRILITRQEWLTGKISTIALKRAIKQLLIRQTRKNIFLRNAEYSIKIAS